LAGYSPLRSVCSEGSVQKNLQEIYEKLIRFVQLICTNITGSMIEVTVTRCCQSLVFCKGLAIYWRNRKNTGSVM